MRGIESLYRVILIDPNIPSEILQQVSKDNHVVFSRYSREPLGALSAFLQEGYMFVASKKQKEKVYAELEKGYQRVGHGEARLAQLNEPTLDQNSLNSNGGVYIESSKLNIASLSRHTPQPEQISLS